MTPLKGPHSSNPDQESLDDIEARLRRRTDCHGLLAGLGLLLLVAVTVALRWGAPADFWPAAGPPEMRRFTIRAPGATNSILEWQQAPQRAFQAPQSRCTIAADGVVKRAPPPPPAAAQLPFLFNLSAEALPTHEQACSHCPRSSGCDPLPAALPAACCGVCGFELRFCSKLYPGQHKSEAVAKRFAAEGHLLHAFTPCELFQRIRGRTLWLLGDSQTLHFYYAVECLLREFAPSLQRTDPLPSPKLVKQLTTATLFLCYEPYPVPPICLELAHGTRVCMVRADTAAVMAGTVLPLLAQHSPGFKEDLVVLNTGLHYYDDVTCKADKGDSCQVPGTDSTYVRDLQLLADYRAANRASLPHIIWMDTPVQHFPGTGNFAGKFRAKECEPLEAWKQGDPVARAGGTWNVAAAPLVESLADAHLRTWNASVHLWDSHMPGECTHWCQPSAYHLWTYLLNGVLRDERLGSTVRLRQPPG